METDMKNPVMAGKYAQEILEELSTWGKTTTIIIHGGCVFEFKGKFPIGKQGQGYYNLDSNGDGFEGHLNLEKIHVIELESKFHRGRKAHAIVFKNAEGEIIFKVFLGRDDKGELIKDQLAAFENLSSKYIEQGD